MIYFIGSMLLVLVFAAFAYPIVRRNAGYLAREDSALAILHDQLDELERDLKRGVILEAEARAARLEIQRRIVAVVQQTKPDVGVLKGGSASIMVAALLVAVFGTALYFNIGSPTIASLQYADRVDEIAGAREIDTATTQLRTRLLASEDGGPTDGWVLLGETYMRLQRYSDASEAFGNLLDRPDVTSGMFSRYAEALVMNEAGVVTPRAERAIDQALELEPANPAGAYYKALALEQAGMLEAAHAILLARLNLADRYYPWMESYISLANFIAADIEAAQIELGDYAPALRGPSQADISDAADLSEEERGAFIASMVDRLAARLEDEPDDLDGWLQLARAFTVLGRPDDAQAAYRSAEPLIANLPDGDPRKQQVSDAIVSQ
jgi:cytochrome c-type biogenesis protein CcmH